MADAAGTEGDGLGVEGAAPPEGQGMLAEPIGNPQHFGGSEWELKQHEQSQFRQTVLRWVGGDGPLGPVVVIRASVGILRKYTEKLLHLGGDKWERGQRDVELQAMGAAEAVAGRAYRAVIVAQARVEQEAHAHTEFLWKGSATWAALPAIARTVKLHNFTLSMGSRLMCLVHELAFSNKAYPFRLFLLLEDRGLEATISQEHCQWCSWTRQFVEKHKGAGLCSEAATEDLRATASMLRVDTSQIEALHATLRRCTVALGCQTHAQMFVDASANMVLRRFRLHGQKLGQRFGEVFGAKATQQDEQQAATENGGQQQRRGGGGAWRAFIASYKDEHPEGSPDFREPASLYHALDPEEVVRLKRVGAQGTRNHREGDAHPFGPTKVAQRREERARVLSNAAAGALAQGDLDPEAADALARGHAEALMMADRPVACDSAWSALLSVKAACAIQGRVKASAKKQREREMAEFESGGGKQIQDALGMAMPSVASRSEDFQAAPRQGSEGQVQHHHLAWQPVRGIMQACRLASLPANGKLGKCIFPRVEAAWHQLHAKVPSTPAAEVKAQDKPSARDACQHARMCVCRKSGGSHLASMVSNLKKAFRQVAANRHGRANLLGARAVVAAIGRSEQHSIEADARRAPLQEQMDANLDQVVFLHLGHLSLKPWAPSRQLLRGEPCPRVRSLYEGPLALDGTCVCRSTCEALADLDKGLRWDLAFFSMVESDRIVSEFNPLNISVEPLGFEQGGRKLHLLWDPFKKSRAGRKRKAGAWDFDFEVSSDSDDKQGRDPEQNDDEEQCDWVAVLDEAMDESEAEGEEEGEASDNDEGDGSQHGGDDAIVVADPPEESMLVATIDECKDEVGPPPPAEQLPPQPLADLHALQPIADNIRLSVGLGKSFLAFYARHQQFYAVCMHANHFRCRLTRTQNPARKHLAAGRPLGYLMAWLADATSYSSAEDHRLSCPPAIGDRRAARAHLHTLDGSEELFAQERDQRVDTDSEPDGLA